MATDPETYTRRKLDLINQREGTSHGEEYYQVLLREVKEQFAFSGMTFATAVGGNADAG
jgi:hypothetical protein